MVGNEFFIHAGDSDKRLFVSRKSSIHSDALSPCCLNAEEVEYEMSCGKHSEIIEISGMTQDGLEYFASKYGKTYRYISFFKSQLIRDFSPLEDLENLESVNIFWNIRADRLWNLAKNPKLKSIKIDDAKKLTYKLERLNTSKSLESVFIGGTIFNNNPMESLMCFSGMETLKQIKLVQMKLENRDFSVLNSLPSLESFDFPAGMLTTEEIAQIVAYYPNLCGSALCAYNKTDAFLNDVRVCGYKKPGLNLPKDQKRLDKYVAQFNQLVDDYKKGKNI